MFVLHLMEVLQRDLSTGIYSPLIYQELTAGNSPTAHGHQKEEKQQPDRRRTFTEPFFLHNLVKSCTEKSQLSQKC